MTAPSPPMFGTLSPADQATLLASDAAVDVGIELLNFDLTVAADLSDYLDKTTGDVQWTGSDTVPRQVTLGLAYELSWGVSLLRIYRTITDPASGLTARVNRGVFCPTTPDRNLGETVNINGQDWTAFSVTGPDRSSLLDRMPGYSVAATMLNTAGVQQTVLANAAQLEAQTGVPGFFDDGAAAASLQPTDMVWPMLPSDSDDTSSTDLQTTASGVDPAITANADTGDSATWRQIINDLYSLVSYRAVWCNEDGLLRGSPYADPSTQAPTRTIDATAISSPVSVQRTVKQDVWGVPNRWIFTWSNMPADSSGNAQSATLANGGVLVLDNPSTGPASQQSRFGLAYATTVPLTAATAADFQAQAAAKKAADMRVATEFSFSLHPAWCVLGHFDVVTLVDPAIPGGSAKVQITSWDESFDNSDISVTAVSV